MRSSAAFPDRAFLSSLNSSCFHRNYGFISTKSSYTDPIGLCPIPPITRRSTVKNTTRKRQTEPPAPAEPQLPTPTGSVSAREPHIGEPATKPDPLKIRTKHDAAGDKAAYAILDKEKGKLKPTAFPPVAGTDEPVLQLADVYGPKDGGKLMGVIQGDTARSSSMHSAKYRQYARSPGSEWSCRQTGERF